MFISLLFLKPVKWKLAKEDLDIGFISPVDRAISAADGIVVFLGPGLLGPSPASNAGTKLRDIMSAADRGLVNGIALCGKVLGFMGVINMCSVQEVSNDGLSNRSTSTFNVRCAKGTANVSGGMLCSQESRLKSESLKPTEPSNSLEKFISTCRSKLVGKN